ncbi:MAG: NGG1p interacting factor NIF3 [Candidatus Omnitrophica bacterium]|nr:NGG1p interacting factor NIF3 [Candidatus Omnitrophota bacterium]
MRLGEIYNSIVKEGIRRDPRGKDGVRSYLQNVKAQYKELSAKEKGFFDREKLTNPFGDTRVLYGSRSKNIKNIIAGIDMDTSEILLAHLLKKKGKKIDLILGHHPEGPARLILHEVMEVQIDLMTGAGVPRKKAKDMVYERRDEVMRKILPSNAMRPVDAARLLDIPFMCAHTPADNFVQDYLDRRIRKVKPRTVQDVMDILLKEPEYQYAASTGAGPRLVLGKPGNRCGKILVEMTGGTGGPKTMFKELAKAGVKTLIGMHISEENFKKAKKHPFNILVAGHISSDTLGINLLLDAVNKKNSLKVMGCSGFKRIRRK